MGAFIKERKKATLEVIKRRIQREELLAPDTYTGVVRVQGQREDINSNDGRDAGDLSEHSRRNIQGFELPLYQNLTVTQERQTNSIEGRKGTFIADRQKLTKI